MNSYNYPKQTRIKFSVTLTIGFIATGFAGVGIYVYANCPGLRDVLTFSATALATSAGVTAASYVSQDLRRSSEASTIDRTLSYIERWNNPDFNKQEIINLMREIRGVNDNEKDEFIRKKLENPEIKSKLISILNFFEEMSLSIEKYLVDETLLHSFFQGIVMDYVGTFETWIEGRSKGGLHSKDNYKGLKQLYRKWGGNGN